MSPGREPSNMYCILWTQQHSFSPLGITMVRPCHTKYSPRVWILPGCTYLVSLFSIHMLKETQTHQIFSVLYCEQPSRFLHCYQAWDFFFMRKEIRPSWQSTVLDMSPWNKHAPWIISPHSTNTPCWGCRFQVHRDFTLSGFLGPPIFPRSCCEGISWAIYGEGCSCHRLLNRDGSSPPVGGWGTCQIATAIVTEARPTSWNQTLHIQNQLWSHAWTI